MPHAIFDSRDSSCKAPFGAVPCGTQIFFTLRPPLAEGFIGCTLILWAEFAEEHWEIPLPSSGTEDGCQVFTGLWAAPAQPDLVWYLFRLRRRNGEVLFLGKNGLSTQESDSVSWQQTVYDATLSTPDWFGRGVTYQIFPDRFRRAGAPRLSGLLGKRTFHPDWYEGLAFLAHRDGESQNHDYFGGNLAGVEEKLPYLKSLGVSTIYFCPIFEADSNHRYNTADYEKIDPMLGSEGDFRRLCQKAKDLGIRVMLDGVFNHTGDNSKYFNAKGAYSSLGVAQSPDSPYYDWYTFQEWPTQYDCWWGFHTLPAVNEDHPDYIDYIVESQDSVIRRWLRAGADAWRLDVADELPDSFIARIRSAIMEEKPDGFLLGEVWEDGSNKIAYSQRRRYLLGREVHSLMNYPFRTAALAYLQGGDAASFMDAMETIRENYPPEVFFSGMNLLGTHDTPRILTLLGTSPSESPASREAKALYRMTEDEYRQGKQLLLIGATLLYTFPGSPTVYYGDETGMEGFEDPFHRGTFPWGREDAELQAHFALLGRLRNERISLQSGDIRWLAAQGHLLAFTRERGTEMTVTVLNTGGKAVRLPVPWSDHLAVDAVSGKQFLAADGSISLEIPPVSGVILIEQERLCFT